MKMQIWSGRSSDGTFRIRITDEAASCCFVEVKMTPENFAYMLANQPVECDGEVMNLNRVGKTKMREQRSVVYTGEKTDKKTIRKWLLEEHQEHGWEMNDQLSSQNSLAYDSETGHYHVNYTVEKWV